MKASLPFWPLSVRLKSRHSWLEYHSLHWKTAKLYKPGYTRRPPPIIAQCWLKSCKLCRNFSLNVIVDVLTNSFQRTWTCFYQLAHIDRQTNGTKKTPVAKCISGHAGCDCWWMRIKWVDLIRERKVARSVRPFALSHVVIRKFISFTNAWLEQRFNQSQVAFCHAGLGL